MTIASLEDIDALTTSVSTYKPRNSIPIVALLCHPICDAIEQIQVNWKAILLATVLAIKKFDNDHSADSVYVQKVKKK